MRQIELTREQREQVMNALAKVHDREGDFDIDIDLGDLMVNASGYIDIDGYVEDDYMNGTGAWVETFRYASVEIYAYDEEGELVIGHLRDEVVDYLNAA